MKRYFITYGDEAFAGAKKRIAEEAKATGQFDEVLVYGPDDVSEAVRNGPLWNERRGGGYWTWKPDVILQTLQNAEEGDVVVYVDGGCEVAKGREWKRYWRIMESKELIVQRIYQINRKWTRKTVQDACSDVSKLWLNQCQFMATVIFFKKTAMTVRLVSEWRRLMIEHPEMVGDVSVEDRWNEAAEFIENRHDQTVFSALVYRRLFDAEERCRICAQWEHIENLSPFRSQVIRAMRNKTDISVSRWRKLKEMVLRVVKDVVRKPYFVIFSLVRRCDE